MYQPATRQAQSVKKAANRQNASFDSWRCAYFQRVKASKNCVYKESENPCCARHFDLLRKPLSTVPMYADEIALLVLAAPLTSASLSKNLFFDRLSLPFGRLIFCQTDEQR